MKIEAQPEVDIQHWPTDAIAKVGRLNCVLRSSVMRLHMAELLSRTSAEELFELVRLVDDAVDAASDAAKKIEERLGHLQIGFNESVDNIMREAVAAWLMQ